MIAPDIVPGKPRDGVDKYELTQEQEQLAALICGQQTGQVLSFVFRHDVVNRSTRNDAM